MNLWVGIGRFHGRPDLARHLSVDGIEPFGTVEGDGGYPAGDLVANTLVIHCSQDDRVALFYLSGAARDLCDI